MEKVENNKSNKNWSYWKFEKQNKNVKKKANAVDDNFFNHLFLGLNVSHMRTAEKSSQNGIRNAKCNEALLTQRSSPSETMCVLCGQRIDSKKNSL